LRSKKGLQLFNSLLLLHGLPVIDSVEDLSKLIRVRIETLERIIRYSDKFYVKYQLPKKTIGYRTIRVPSRQLKGIQSWILRNILDHLCAHPASKGFDKGLSIKNNAQPHIGATHLVKLDMENFFGTVTASQIYTIFRSIGYSSNIASKLTSLCSCDGFLPQGSPASPKLANLVCHRLDGRIQGYISKSGLNYTRYADDITISGFSSRKVYLASLVAKKVIESEQFSVNTSKTFFVGPNRRKKVTGLIVGTSKVGIGRNEYRNMRLSLYRLLWGKQSDYKYIIGKLNWIKDVDQDSFRRLKSLIERLLENQNNLEFTNELMRYKKT